MQVCTNFLVWFHAHFVTKAAGEKFPDIGRKSFQFIRQVRNEGMWPGFDQRRNYSEWIEIIPWFNLKDCFHDHNTLYSIQYIIKIKNVSISRNSFKLLFKITVCSEAHSSTLDSLLFTQPLLTGQPPQSKGTVSIGLLGNN